jgi:hypothetical protein
VTLCSAGMLEVDDAAAPDREAERTEAFRAGYRRDEIGPAYRGWLHFAFTTVGSLAAIAFAISQLSAVTPLEWLTVPASFFIANFGEYFGHRGPMHHRRRGLGLLHHRHTMQHHRFFTERTMECDTSRDFKMVLFPPVLLLFFIGGLALPIGLVLFAVFSANVGWLFAATAIAYFLSYEWLHFSYHQPPDSFVGRLPFVPTLRRHHAVHHDPARMQRWNFNITFPIADRVMGTSWRE